MKTEKNKLIIEIPENVDVGLSDQTITVSGEKGQLTRTFPNVGMAKKDNQLILSVKTTRRKQLAILGTIRGHVKNLVQGVSEGITYKMKIVYTHFPMTVKVQGDEFVIDNFLGEKHPRKTKILEGVTIEINGQDILLTGTDKENVGQTAANIEQVTHIKNLDPRVFQDGCYIVSKDGKKVK